MAELKPETKIAKVIAKMSPLADWFASNKPSVNTIRLPPDDLKILSDHPEAAMAHGVSVAKGGVKWRNFYLKSA
jgi:hypothetical protein